MTYTMTATLGFEAETSSEKEQLRNSNFHSKLRICYLRTQTWGIFLRIRVLNLSKIERFFGQYYYYFRYLQIRPRRLVKF